MSSTVEQVKARLGIVEVVSGYTKLERAGQNWKARCPFHNEKTPSFFVSPTRQSYHCFGCNRGGDIISFVEEIEGLDFLGALKLLAERAGVAFAPLASQPEQAERETLYRLLAEARDYYTSELARQPAVRNYLASRGLKLETIQTFGLGFAPAGWQNLCQYLAAKRYSDDLVLKSGLVLKSPKDARPYDRFRSRIMFPLADGAGRIVGFSGRIFGETPPETGKYINTPETLLYQKSRLLYGLERAKLSIRRNDTCVVVEGQMDLLLSHQAGFNHTVALSGTALTSEQLVLIRRLTENMIMAFDGDDAGVAAAKRSLNLALAAGLNVKLVSLPSGEDPAELLAKPEGAETWRAQLATARPVIDFLLEHFSSAMPDRLTLIHALEREVYPYLAVLPNIHDRDHYLAKIVRLTQLPDNSVREKLLQLATKEMSPAPVPDSALVASRRDRIVERLWGLETSGRTPADGLRTLLGERLYGNYQEVLRPRVNELTLAVELAYAGMDQERLAKEISELRDALEVELCREAVEDHRFRLAQAEQAGQTSEVTKLLGELQNLYKRISDLKNHHGNQK